MKVVDGDSVGTIVWSLHWCTYRIFGIAVVRAGGGGDTGILISKLMQFTEFFW
jgi:hypothetical protein